MNMVAKAHYRKYFSWCFLKPPFLLLLVTLIPSTVFLCFLSSHGLFSLLTTITVLFISTTVLLLKFSKKKTRVCLDEKPVQEKEEINPELQVEEDESASLGTQTQPSCVAQVHEDEFDREITDLPSDSESSSETEESEGLEHECVSSRHMDQKTSVCVCDVSSCSDDDEDEDEDEDEDGLIEIALVNEGSKGLCEEPKKSLQNFWVQYSVSREEELINDVSIEEENLIEIDISMGSIKRSAIEI